MTTETQERRDRYRAAGDAFDNGALPREDRTLLGQNRGYWIDDKLYVVYRNRLWKRTGQTYNPRVVALADAVGWNGELLTVHTEGPRILLQHHVAGIELELWAGTLTEWCFVTFDEVDQFGTGTEDSERA